LPSWGGKNYISELGARIELRVSCPESIAPWPVQRRSIAFSKGPPKNQNDENEKGTQHNDLPLGDGASCAPRPLACREDRD
jgi:hypothetical protein